MSDVIRVAVTIRNPDRMTNDPGQVAYGYYKLDKGLLTMTTPDGVTMRRDKTGEPYTHVMKPGDDPGALARVMTRKIHETLHGKTMASFTRPIRYPRVGVA
jgi:hypothetical protein